MLSPFDDLNLGVARNIIQTYDSPVYLVCSKTLIQRYQALDKAFKALWPNCQIAYSYKTNPLTGIARLLHAQGAWAEVVSRYELEIALNQVPAGQPIVFNGPLKSDDDLALALRHGVRIHVDHMDELQRLEFQSRKLGLEVDVGLRLNINERDGWQRFGFAINGGAVDQALDYIRASRWLTLAGIHTHIGTNIRDLSRFRQMAIVVNQFVIMLYQTHGIQLQWIDVGGGLAGQNPSWDENISQHPIPNASEYASAILPPLLAGLPEDYQPQVLFEPGRTLLEPCVALLTQVVGTRDSDIDEQVLIIDGGINAVPTAKVYRHRVEAFGTPVELPGSERRYATTLFGPLCLQADTIAKGTPLARLECGSPLLIHNVGAYNQSRSVPFIRLRPGTLLWQEKGCQWLRKPETLSDHLRLETMTETEAV